MDLDWLKSVVDDDDLDLLRIKKNTSAPSADEHLLANFTDINDFISVNGRQPEPDMTNVPEYMLHQRLNSICDNPDHCETLRDADIHNLLPVLDQVAEPKKEYKQEKEINTLEDIFSDDDLGLLDDSESSIFKLRNVPLEKAETDFVARRKQCKNFSEYKDTFKQVQNDLKSGDRKLFIFSENHLRNGGYFILDGVLLWLKSIDMEIKKQKYSSGSRTRKDGRTHIIFENGTESNMLLRSLYKQLLKNGKSVSETNDESLAIFNKNLSGLTDDDNATGYIYILQSLSPDPKINTIQNLYKIGYATISVEKRIANAENEPTYLMAPVKYISGYQCFNMNTQKFESLLHTFFGNACLDIEVIDMNGKACKPREWFIAPLPAIELAIQLMINGEIINYRYDPVNEEVIEH